MNVTIREMEPADQMIWAEMRAELWPDETVDIHRKELEEFLQRGNFWGFLAQDSNSDGVGFAEIAVREFANGCISRPVAFLEGVWVKPQFRRRGIGTRLLETVEAFLGARGFCELGSDALIDNHESHSAHTAWGFTETERVVYFRKCLRPVTD